MNIHPAQQPIEVLVNACQFRRQRRSGPGGQHRNKVETGVFIEHTPTGVTAAATEKRSQDANRRRALLRLRIRLAVHHRTPAPYPLSMLWKERCRHGRISVNVEHDDFPAILAEALDVLAWNHFEVAAAAAQLGCTSSQLVKLLRAEPAALAYVNTIRIENGAPPLK
jgi:hypothetical protein